MIWNEENMKETILLLAKKLNVNRMPTSMEMRENRMSGLSRAIGLNGGMNIWANKVGLSMKEREVHWTTDEIKQELLKSIEILMLDRMPTAEELRLIGRNDLHCKISRTKKYSGWAEELGLKLKSCETRMGHKYEAHVTSTLKLKGFNVERMTTKHPYDLMVNGCVKIDVKSANPYYLKGSRVHTFNLYKPNPSCDIYICVLLNEEHKSERTFVIPSHLAKIKTLCVGKESKYNRFIDRWDIVSKYANFLQGVS